MGFKFNPLFPLLDMTGSGGGGGGGYAGFKAPVTEATLPTVGNTDGDFRVTTDTDYSWTWDAASSRWINMGVKSSVIGSTPNANSYSLVDVNVGLNRTERRLQLQPADGSNPGIITTAAQTIAGSKTFTGVILADTGIDVTATGGTDTLAIGTTNADIINIGRSGITINLIGATINQTVTNLNVTDKNITLNSGGGIGSGSTVGIEVEENAIITGYFETSGDRNSWELKAPNTAGIITLTPGASGFTINQGSHNPVTLGAVGSSPNANSATLTNQVLNLEPASITFPGVITTGTQSIAGDKTFTGNITAANLTGSNTGDVTLTAFGSVPNANAASLSGQALTLQPADATNPGGVSIGAQTFAGNKTFNNNLIVIGSTTLATSLTGPLKATAGLVSSSAINLTTEVTGILPIANGGTNLSTTPTNGQLLIGNGTDYTLAGLTGTANQITVTPGSGSITLSTPQDIDSGASPTFLGLTLSGVATGVLKSSSGVISSSDVDLTTEVTGILPIANGGTNSSVTLNNDRIIVSSAGSIVEAAALTNGQLLIGSTGAAPVAATITAGTGISITNGAGSITVNATASPGSPGDIEETSFTGLVNNTADQVITGFAFANATVRSFDALVSIAIDDGAAGLFASYKLYGIQKGSSWELTQEFTGDTIVDTSFNITSAGQIRISTGNISGFVDALIKFRAITTSVI